MTKNKEFTKRFLYVFLLSAALILSVLFVIYRAEVKSRMAYMENRNAGTLSTIESAIYHDMSAILSDIKVLREINEMKQFLYSPSSGGKTKIGKEFLVFSEGRRFYDQIRLLDDKGMEVVRVNFNNGNPSIVPDDKLQDKAGYYYFTETFKLSKGEVYISPFDLNVENGKVERPFKPMIRIGTPVFDGQGRKRGMIILNYLGSHIVVDEIKKLAGNIDGHAMLVNPEGYWLVGERPEYEWGFMFEEGKDLKIENRYPDAWKQILASDSGQFYDANGLFIFKTLRPMNAFFDSKEYYWKLIINTPPEVLSSNRKDLDRGFLALSVFFMLLQGIVAWYFAYAWTRKNESEKALRKAHDELDARVQERTEELERTTEKLRSTNEELENEIVERRDAESRLFRVNRVYLVLSRINETIIHSRDKEQIFSEACRITVEEGRFAMAWIGVVDPASLLVRPVASYGDKESYVEKLRISVKDEAEGRGPVGTAIRERKPYICNDSWNDPNLAPWREHVVKSGYRSSATFPLYSVEGPIGVMILYSEETNSFNEDEVGLLTQLTNNLSYSISSLRAYEREKKIEEILWSTAKGISAETGDEFFASMVQYIGKTLNVDYAFIGQVTDKDISRVRTVALYAKGKIADNFEYDLEGTPCMTVVGKEPCSYPDGVQSLFPEDHLLVGMGINCYIGIPLFDSSGSPIGLISVMDGKGAEDPEMTKSILQIFAARAAAEIERKGIEEEKKKVEKQLLHSQKMDAVGQLAGGIAHDFNNVLTAILGFSKLLLVKRGDDELVKNYTQHIIDAGESAASLVQGILAFSRKQTILPQPVDIAELVRNVEKILLRLISEDIELRTDIPDASMIVKADPIQIEQVLMNLATNARDAMLDGGGITISVEAIELDEEFVKAHGYGEPGNYALLSFADTGVGMDEETRKRIFEPFFTTKEVGKGTGLGLATAYGVVKQHNGFINVYSEPGKGTTFRIYLPLAEPAAGAGKPRKIITPERGTETVLLVEDDKMVRAITLKVLEEFGFNVIVAVNGEDAVSKFKENKDKIHLCISDMVMPKMGGREAFEEMRKMRPDLKVIFMSGYAADKTKGIIEEGLDFISKPVSPSDFLRKVREVLDR